MWFFNIYTDVFMNILLVTCLSPAIMKCTRLLLISISLSSIRGEDTNGIEESFIGL